MMDMSNIKVDFWGEVNIEKMFDIHDNQKVEIYTSGAGAIMTIRARLLITAQPRASLRLALASSFFLLTEGRRWRM